MKHVPIEKQIRQIVGAIRAAREARGIAIDDAAAFVGISANHLYGIEAGRNQPHIVTLEALAKAVGGRIELTFTPNPKRTK